MSEISCIKLPVYSQEFKQTLHVDIPTWLEEQEERPDIIHFVYTHLRNNKRMSNNGGVLSKSESSYSTKKLSPQKGRGAARRGSRKSGLLRKGCKAHGPTGLENYKTKVNKKVKKLALLSMFKHLLNQKRVFVFEDNAFLNIEKTSQADFFIKNVNNISDNNSISAAKKRSVIVLSSDLGQEKISKAFANLKNTWCVGSKHVHVTSMLVSDYFIISVAAFNQLISRLMPQK